MNRSLVQIKDKDGYYDAMYYNLIFINQELKRDSCFLLLPVMFNLLANFSLREEAEASSPFRAVQVHLVEFGLDQKFM